MCGRCACTLNPNIYQEQVSKNLGSKDIKWLYSEEYKPTYNIAPTMMIPVVHYQNSTEETQEVIIETMRWGLIPSFSKSIKTTLPQMHNARGESIQEKSVFKRLLSSKRCVIYIDGYYEWKRSQKKLPYYIKRKDSQLLCIAGLYDVCEDDSKKITSSFTILTIEPGKDFQWLHDRMPVILTPEEAEIWMNSEKYSIDEALKLVKSTKVDILDIFRVTEEVNSSQFNSSKCIKKFEQGAMDKFLKRKIEVVVKEEELETKRKKE